MSRRRLHWRKVLHQVGSYLEALVRLKPSYQVKNAKGVIMTRPMKKPLPFESKS